MTTDIPRPPLHYRVFRALQDRIADQRYRAGDRLPSEEALCREFGVSRITVRRAIGRLVELGVIARWRGRGMFVAEASARPAATPLMVKGSLESLFAQVETNTVKSVTLAEEMAPDSIRAILGLAPGEPVTRARRVRALDARLLALTINYLPRSIGSRLREADLYRLPLVQLFEDRLHVRIVSAEQTIEARAADAEVAEALDLRFGDPVLYTERVLFAAGRRAVEVMRSWYRPDVYQIRVELSRQRDAPFKWQFTDPGRA